MLKGESLSIAPNHLIAIHLDWSRMNLVNSRFVSRSDYNALFRSSEHEKNLFERLTLLGHFQLSSQVIGIPRDGRLIGWINSKLITFTEQPAI